MSARKDKTRKVSRKLKLSRALRLQRILSGRTGAWCLEPSGDLHDVDPQDCLKISRTQTDASLQTIEDNNDEFERDRVGF